MLPSMRRRSDCAGGPLASGSIEVEPPRGPAENGDGDLLALAAAERAGVAEFCQRNYERLPGSPRAEGDLFGQACGWFASTQLATVLGVAVDR